MKMKELYFQNINPDLDEPRDCLSCPYIHERTGSGLVWADSKEVQVCHAAIEEYENSSGSDEYGDIQCGLALLVVRETISESIGTLSKGLSKHPADA